MKVLARKLGWWVMGWPMYFQTEEEAMDSTNWQWRIYQFGARLHGWGWR